MPAQPPGPSPEDDVATRYGPLAPPGAEPPRDRSYWVVVDRLAGGAYPYEGDPAVGDKVLTGLITAGIDAFVDLTQVGLPGPSDMQLTDYGGSPAMPATVERVRRPIDDLSIPAHEDLVTTLDEIDRLLEDGRTVYVHCWGGVGRTGVVVGAWLIRHGVATGDTVMDVLGRLRTADAVGGRTAPEMPGQVAFLRRFRE